MNIKRKEDSSIIKKFSENVFSFAGKAGIVAIVSTVVALKSTGIIGVNELKADLKNVEIKKLSQENQKSNDGLLGTIFDIGKTTEKREEIMEDLYNRDF